MRISVVKNSKIIGYLDESKEGEYLFEYKKGTPAGHYLHGLQKRQNSSAWLFPVFESLMPENEQLESIKVKHYLKREIDVLLYLDNIHGSFEFYREEEYEQQNIPESTGIFNFPEVRDEILNAAYAFPNILKYELQVEKETLHPVQMKSGKAMGLSGFQYKFAVLKDDSAQTITRCRDNESDYIMKPYNIANARYVKAANPEKSYIPYLLVNEHLFMSMARDFGFKVPYNAIIRDGNDYHYIIRRYDRYKGSKIDHYDMLTLLGGVSKDKYNITVVQIMRKAKEYLSKEEIIELYRFFIFSSIIAHGDLHAKNISLIFKTNDMNEKKMVLAPYYDISTIDIYKSIKGRDLGMKLKNKYSKISRDDFLWLADQCEVDRIEAGEHITSISHQFIDTFLDYIEKLPHEVRALPIQKNVQGYADTLEVIFKKYYNSRVAYINKSLLKHPIPAEDPWGAS